jgi:molybdate transport system substrate-binding protein
MPRRRLLPLLLGAMLAWAVPISAQPQQPLTVFAAASLADALRILAEAWVARGNQAPRFSFAASSSLARQIEQGAPADLFISADEEWMDYLAARGLVVPATRVSPIGNVLVLVTPADQPRTLALRQGFDLAALLGTRERLALADPAHVPAGRYAEAALRWMGQWDALLPRLARADNVRAALLLVERGEAPLGIVYATDAAISARVRVAGSFPPQSHPPITYPFAVTRRAADSAEAQSLLAFLVGPAARPVWDRFGFTDPR